MTNPSFSIITPMWKGAGLVGATIDSVLAQSFPDWEMIIVDDCSPDDGAGAAVVQSYADKDPRIKLIRATVNRGSSGARNQAMETAKGRYFAFLDSDDQWEPTKLEKQVQFMEVNGYAFSYTEYQEMDSEGTLTGVVISGPKHIAKRGMYNFCWPGCLTVMYDREKVGLIQIEDIKKNNDYAMWLKVCKKEDCYLLPEVLAKYRRGRCGSVSSHAISTMIGWHYKLWREAEKRSVVVSVWLTGVNLVCGFYKKIKYVYNNQQKTEVKKISNVSQRQIIKA